jgi:hypothetical protein
LPVIRPAYGLIIGNNAIIRKRGNDMMIAGKLIKKYQPIELWFLDGSRTVFYGYELEKYADKYQFSASDFMNSPKLDIGLYDDENRLIGGVQAI